MDSNQYHTDLDKALQRIYCRGIKGAHPRFPIEGREKFHEIQSWYVPYTTLSISVKPSVAVQFEFLRLDLKIAFCESSSNESKVVDRIVHTLDGWLNPNENIMLQLGSLHILNEFASIRCELFDFLMDRYRKHIMDIAKNCMDVDMTLSVRATKV